MTPRCGCTSTSTTWPRSGRRAGPTSPIRSRPPRLCEAAGADGITAHLREDRRHIQDDDLERSRPAVQVLNLELATSAEIVALACRLRPTRPRSSPSGARRSPPRAASISAARAAGCAETIRRLDEAGIRVSLFIDPDPPPSTPPRTSACPPSSCTPAATPTPGAGATRRSTSSAAPRGTPPTWGSPCTPATGSPT